MDFQKNLQTCDDLLALECLNRNADQRIQTVLEVIRQCDVYSIDRWRTYELVKNDPAPPNLFQTELRENGIRRCIKAVWEAPEDGVDIQLWMFVEYSIMEWPDDTIVEKTARFPARYLFMTEMDIRDAWQKHLDKYGHKVQK